MIYFVKKITAEHSWQIFKKIKNLLGTLLLNQPTDEDIHVYLEKATELSNFVKFELTEFNSG
jgi:hypothetical protein